MANIVIHVPVELRPIADAIKTLLTEAHSSLGCAGGGPARDYGRFEGNVHQWVAAMERSVHQVVLSSLDVDAPRVLIDGRAYS